MKTFLKIGFLVAVLAPLAALAQAVDPADAVKELNELRQKRIADARASGSSIDLNALNREIEEKALAYVFGVVAATVDPNKGYAWGQLFALAGKHAESRTAARRYLEQGSPSQDEVWPAQVLILDASNALKDGATLAKLLKEIVPANSAVALTLGSRYVSLCVPTIAATLGVDEALATIDAVEKNINFAAFAESEAAQRDGLKVTLALTRANTLEQAGVEPHHAQAQPNEVARQSCSRDQLRQQARRVHLAE
jgi:hypothetical protein